MNTQEYISSGIVESYVLGLATQEEAAEFERACGEHAEVRAARDAFELVLERQSLAAAVPPPPDLKAAVMKAAGVSPDLYAPKAIEIDPDADATFPVDPTAKYGPAAPTVQMQRSAGRFSFMAAAAVVLLVVSAVLNFFLYREYNTMKEEQQQLVAQNQSVMNRIGEAEKSLAMIKDPNNLPVVMQGVGDHKESKATIYWNQQSRDVFLVVNNLPRPEAGKQYQLWAIVDGAPVDAGMIELNEEGKLVSQMKNIPSAQAFAVTLEKEGGVSSPTLSAMYVMGEI